VVQAGQKVLCARPFVGLAYNTVPLLEFGLLAPFLGFGTPEFNNARI